MKLIFLYGMPAAGKLTVGRELADITGYKLFHNHLTVDMLLSVFDFGSPSFVSLREAIWLSVFEQACHDGTPGMIFTFAPESSVRQSFIDETVRRVKGAGGEVVFVELVCPREQLTSRLEDPSRHAYKKLTSATLFNELEGAGTFQSPRMPRPLVSVDTGRSGPKEAAAQIVQALTLNKDASFSR